MKSALTTVLITLLTLVTVQTSSDNYKKVGDTVVLSPGSVSAPITSITWKHNSNLTVEWNGGEIDFYPKFKDRCKLNTTTGELIISGLTLEDSGSYTAEINNRVMNPTEITVISVVPPPTVSTACDHEMTYCVLTCDVNTTDPEPLTYYWILDGRAVWYEEKSLNLTKEESSMHLISCAVENPVSSESSKEVLNPFISSSNYKKVGDTVVLSPGSVSAPITSITWRHNSKFAVIWTGDEIYCSSKFKGRCKLNTTTGELTISGLTLEDSGSYTAEINDRVMNTTEVTVI